MTPTVISAIEGLKKAFPTASVTIISEDGQGGAFVVLENIALGEKFSPPTTWFGAHLPANLPYADIYPLFMGADVKKANGQALQGPLTQVSWQNRPSIQVSRRNNRVGAGHTAVSKFVKVIEFVKGLT